ncbi:hypothetical protein TNCV_2838331 [Trichonephila clavipes]|nr:hypothetical protein TNCV_2838331 [Trichonephila clavipes]
MALELASPSPNYHTNGRTLQLSTDLKCITPLHGGSLVVLGSNWRQGKSRSNTYTTRLLRPPRTSDINHLDFFFRYNLITHVYKTPMATGEELTALIVVATAHWICLNASDNTMFLGVGCAVTYATYDYLRSTMEEKPNCTS